MNKITTTSTILLFSFSILMNQYKTLAQTPTWQWARSAGGTGQDRGYSTAVDLNGNVYVTGFFDSLSINFGSTTLSNSGMEDLFIVKYDQAGNVLWARSAGGNKTESGYGITCDDSGNVFVTGSFESSSITFGSITLNNSGMKDVFIVKYDSGGNVRWAIKAGGNGDEGGNNITTDHSGNVLVTGNFNSPSITFGSTILYAVGTSKVFVVKYDTNGNILWANGTNGLSFDGGRCVTVDINNDVYIAGEYYNTSVIIGTDTFTNQGDDDIYLAKFSSNGNYLWATTAGGFNTDKVTGIVTEGNNIVFITGHFWSPFITFGATTLNNAGFGAWDLYIVKYDASHATWAKSATGNSTDDESIGIARDNDNNIYIGGWYRDSITFGSTTLNGIGAYDLYVAKYDSAGSTLWAVNANGTDQNFATCMTADVSGNIYLTGFFNSQTLSFGTSTINDSNTGWDMFVAKLGDDPVKVSELSNEELITVYPNPNNGIFHLDGNITLVTKVEIFSTLGECIYRSVFQDESRIDLTGIPKGIYFCRLTIEQNEKIIIHNKKILIE